MDVTLDQCQKLVADVQVAHRLLVAYYERLTSRMDMVARDLDARFIKWDPTETERPCRAKTQPSRHWLWDMVPLYAAYHAYGKTSANTIRVGDFAICFTVYSDDAFDSENRKRAGVRGKPDPLNLPAGEGLLVVEVFLAGRNTKKTWDELWDDLDDPDPMTGRWGAVGNDVDAIAFKLPLAEFMHDPAVARARISTLVAGKTDQAG